MKIKKTVSKEEWLEILKACPEATFFATPAWAEILQRTYGFDIATRLFIFEDGQMVLLPMMKIKVNKLYGLVKTYNYLSVPFYNYGGLFSQDPISMEKVESILDSLRSMFASSVVICPHPLSKVEYPEKFKGEEYSTYILDISDGFEKFWGRYEDRDQARKARKANVQISIEDNLKSFQEYYEMYLDSTKRWGLSNPQPWALYENLCLFAKDYIKLWVARLDGKAIAGIILGYFNQNVTYWGAAFYYHYGPYRPNNLLHIEAIKNACENGYKNYDFLPSGSIKGVEKFKESFGVKKIYFKTIRIKRRSLR